MWDQEEGGRLAPVHFGTDSGPVAALRQVFGAWNRSRRIYSPWEWGRKIQPGRYRSRFGRRGFSGSTEASKWDLQALNLANCPDKVQKASWHLLRPNPAGNSPLQISGFNGEWHRCPSPVAAARPSTSAPIFGGSEPPAPPPPLSSNERRISLSFCFCI